MKRKTAVIIIIVCLVMLFAAPAAGAAGDVCFTAIESRLNPLNDNTMPVIINGLLYIPCAFFTSDALGVYYFSSNDKALLYSGPKQLSFDVEKGTVLDQDSNTYNIPAVKKSGRIYVPVDKVCTFFELTYQVINNNLAPIIRFYKGPIYISAEVFYSMNKSNMQTYYDEYMAGSSSHGASPTPSPSPTYANVTMYLSFSELVPERFDALLDTLALYRYKACFFVSADEIVSNAGLIRQAAGAGHTIGIWLKDGTFEEYQAASDLLFKAAKLKTILVSAAGDAEQTAEETAAAKGLAFWKAANAYDGTEKSQVVITRLTEISSSRDSINVTCTDKTVSLIGSLLLYLSDKQYDVRRVTETTSPIYTLS